MPPPMKLTLDQALRKAATFALKGQKAEAEKLYRAVLEQVPDESRAAEGLRALAPVSHEELPQADVERLVALSDGNRPNQALAYASALMGRYPDAALLYSVAGVATAQLDQFPQALAHFDKVFELLPNDAANNRNRGNALRSLGRLEEAIESFDRALQVEPTLLDALISRGHCLKDLDRLEEAVASYEAALEVKLDQPDLWYNSGNILLELKRVDEALICFDQAIAYKPDWAEAHNNRGNLLREQGRLEEALASYDTALRLKPDLGSAHNNRGVVLKDLGRQDEALAASELAVQFAPDFNAHNNRGVVLHELKRLDEALVCFDAAVRLKPDSAAAYNNAGNVLQDLGRFEDAIKCYDMAIQVSPELADAFGNRGNALDKLGRPAEAVASYAQALERQPGYAPLEALMLYQKAHICDWNDPVSDADLARIGIVGEGVGTFTMLALEDDPVRQLERARNYTRVKLPEPSPPLPRPAARPEKLRIGYFSADFQDHAMMLLMARVFEMHDRDRFEFHAFSYGPDQLDFMRKRAIAAFDRFHEVRNLTDAAMVDLAREMQIDVAVDLSGYTRGARTAVFAHRVAPVQMNFLGYPGSLGADFIDYIVADRVVVPLEARQFCDEKVIYMPHSYQANDSGRGISNRVFARAELGLPENGFVFCCFNNNYKIGAEEFGIWMRLLGKIEGSVLWLLEGNATARVNLRREAEARGVDPDRLVFAPRMPSGDHLARHRCADLFLDTFNYNAHTTGSDALWAGLPIVTRLGRSFPARVGGSLLHATGMDELVTGSSAEYEALALALATDPARMAAVRAKLAAQLPTAPLFDSESFARDLERAYEIAFARRVAGLPADHIDLAAEHARVEESA